MFNAMNNDVDVFRNIDKKVKELIKKKPSWKTTKITDRTVEAIFKNSLSSDGHFGISVTRDSLADYELDSYYDITIHPEKVWLFNSMMGIQWVMDSIIPSIKQERGLKEQGSKGQGSKGDETGWRIQVDDD